MFGKIKTIIFTLLFVLLILKSITWFFAKQIVDELQIAFARTASVEHFPYIDFHWRGYISLRDVKIHLFTYQEPITADEMRIHLPTMLTLFQYNDWHTKPESIAPVRIELISAKIPTGSPAVKGFHEYLASSQNTPIAKILWPQCEDGSRLTPDWFIDKGQSSVTADIILNYKVNAGQLEVDLQSYWLGLFNINWQAKWRGEKMLEWNQKWPENASLSYANIDYEDTGLLNTFWHQCANNANLAIDQYVALRNRAQASRIAEMGINLGDETLQQLYNYYKKPHKLAFELSPKTGIQLEQWQDHTADWNQWLGLSLEMNGKTIPASTWTIDENKLKQALGIPLVAPKPKPTGTQIYYDVWQDLDEDSWHTARNNDVKITLKSGEIHEGKLTEVFSQHIELSEQIGSGYVARRYAPWKVHQLQVKKRLSKIVRE